MGSGGGGGGGSSSDPVMGLLGSILTGGYKGSPPMQQPQQGIQAQPQQSGPVDENLLGWMQAFKGFLGGGQ